LITIGGKEMICPFLMSATMITEGVVAQPIDKETVKGLIACQQAKCAWYEKVSGKCAVLVIAERLNRQINVALAK
jgi:hypothetical protein